MIVVVPPEKPVKEFIICDIGQFLCNAYDFINVIYNLPSLFAIHSFIRSSSTNVHRSEVFLGSF